MMIDDLLFITHIINAVIFSNNHIMANASLPLLCYAISIDDPFRFNLSYILCNAYTYICVCIVQCVYIYRFIYPF